MYIIQVHITIEEPRKKKSDMWLSKPSPNAKKGCRVLSYWCFSPGFGYDFINFHKEKKNR